MHCGSAVNVGVSASSVSLQGSLCSDLGLWPFPWLIPSLIPSLRAEKNCLLLLSDCMGLCCHEAWQRDLTCYRWSSALENEGVHVGAAAMKSGSSCTSGPRFLLIDPTYFSLQRCEILALAFPISAMAADDAFVISSFCCPLGQPLGVQASRGPWSECAPVPCPHCLLMAVLRYTSHGPPWEFQWPGLLKVCTILKLTCVPPVMRSTHRQM